MLDAQVSKQEPESVRQKPHPGQCEIVFPNAIGLLNSPVVRAEELEFLDAVLDFRVQASSPLLEDPT